MQNSVGRYFKPTKNCRAEPQRRFQGIILLHFTNTKNLHEILVQSGVANLYQLLMEDCYEACVKVFKVCVCFFSNSLNPVKNMNANIKFCKIFTQCHVYVFCLSDLFLNKLCFDFKQKYAKLLQNGKFISDKSLTDMYEEVKNEVLCMFMNISLKDVLDAETRRKFYTSLVKKLNLLKRVFCEENAIQQVNDFCFPKFKVKQD